jgi:hypothetical protein
MTADDGDDDDGDDDDGDDDSSGGGGGGGGDDGNNDKGADDEHSRPAIVTNGSPAHSASLPVVCATNAGVSKNKSHMRRNRMSDK